MSRGKTVTKPYSGWGSSWGEYDSISELPNVSGATEQDSNLNYGDTAWVSADLYVCTDPSRSAATWKKILRSGGTLAEAVTFSGGIVGSTPLKIYNHDLGAAIASRGTDGVSVAGTIYYSQIFIPCNKTITGLAPLKGTTIGSDAIIVGLYSMAGVLLANSALAGEALATADKYQEVDFTTPYAAVGPATYLAAFQLDGTTDGMQRIATDGNEVITGSQAGSFGTMAAISSVATTFTTALGPMVYAY